MQTQAISKSVPPNGSAALPKPSGAATKTDAARSVFIFNTPPSEQTIANGLKFKKQFGMRKCRFNLPEHPQAFSFVYLLTEAQPANFPHPRVYNFSEVPNESAPTTKPSPARKPAAPRRILSPAAPGKPAGSVQQLPKGSGKPT